MRTLRPRARARGFTAIEAAIAVGLVGLSVATVGGVFARSSALAADSRATLRVHEEHRRNLETIANTLRGASRDSLTGFAADGTSTSPRFETVSGADASGLTSSGTEVLLWVPSPRPVNGVAQPGLVVHTMPGSSRVVADRVPKTGFLVRREGDNLVIRLTTYYATSQRKTALLTGETAVFVRNGR
jgi:hypothetical protein